MGELRKLGVTVSVTSVRNVCRRHGLPPAWPREGPNWSEFLRSQGAEHAGHRLFHIDAVNGRDCILFVIDIERRVVHLLGVTTNSNGQRVTQMVRSLVCDPEEAKRAIRFQIGDRDTKVTAAFDEVLRSAHIQTVRTPVRAPRANAFAERWVEIVRAECLDHLLISCASRISAGRAGAGSSGSGAP